MRSVLRTSASLLLLWLFAAPAFAIPFEELEHFELEGIPKQYDQLCGGGGGKYVLLHSKAEKKIVVIDLEAGKVKGSITLPAEDAVFAAGQTKAVIALPGQKLLQRWNLDTLEREKTIPLGDLAPRQIALGSASEGPVVIWQEGKVQLWDLSTFKPLKTSGDLLGGDSMYGFNVTAAADGRTFVGWIGNISGQRFAIMRLKGSNATITETPDDHSFGGRWAVPNADGSYVIRYGGTLYDYAIKLISAESLTRWAIVPSDDPRFLLGAMRDEKDERNFSTISIWSANDRQQLCSIDKVPTVTSYDGGGPDLAHHRYQFRIRYVPQLNRMLILPEGNARAILINLNLKEHLERTLKDQGADYVYVISKPPAVAAVGENFRYQLETLSNSDTLQYKVESGPDGLRVSDKGLVEWKATRPTGGVASVVLHVSNPSGAETFHSFELQVERPAIASKPPKEGPKSKSKPGKEPADEPDTPKEKSAPSDSGSADSPPATSGDFAQAEPNRLELPGTTYEYLPALDGKYGLILCGSKLGVLAADGITLKKTLELPRDYIRLGERKNYYVGLANPPNCAVEIIDKKTLKVVRSQRFDYREAKDLALHPTKPISYASFNSRVAELPGFNFAVVDETKATAIGSDGFIASWLQVDPAGRFLYAAYFDIYKSGSRLIQNPGNWFVVPDYGSLNWLIRYDLANPMAPKFVEMFENAGGSGRGVRLSADGTRVTFLSNVGTPPGSGNLFAWDTRDTDRQPVTYATKDRASTLELAYHPVLPLVASPGKHSVACFQRETGELLEDRVAEAESLQQGELERLWFSPDGKSVICGQVVRDARYLVRVDLKLSLAERKLLTGVRRGPNPSTVDGTASADPSPERRGPIVSKPLPALKELEALAPGARNRRELSAKEIGRTYLKSVVLITTDSGVGTGFVIGSRGYVLTCAHVVDDAATCTITVQPDDDAEKAEHQAEVIKVDHDRDLALLKVDAKTRFTPVRLSSGKVESGERVTAIGNPGLGQRVLSSTMTEGIVSNPRRELDGLHYVQTSAAVNPGSSGGPLFNSFGEVIGLVVLKGKIEGAGFAVPAFDIASFLGVAQASEKGSAKGPVKGPEKGAQQEADNNFPTGAAKQPAQVAPELRTWSDPSGKFKVEATYAGRAGQNIKLKKPNGEILTVPASRLSPADQEYLKGRK